MRRFLISLFALLFLCVVLWLLIGPRVTKIAERVVDDVTEQSEAWIGDQLLELADRALVPTLTADRVEIVTPTTIVLHGLALTSAGETFISADRVEVTLAQLPLRGKPLIIEAISFDRPVVRLIENPEGGLVGYDPMVEVDANDDSGPAGPISDSFAFRTLRIVDGTLTWERPDGETMHLDELALELDGSAGDEPGAYNINLAIDRPPFAELQLEGVFDLDALALELTASSLRINLAPDEYHMLPVSIQPLVRDHQIHGDLLIEFAGRIPFVDGETSGAWKLALNEADGQFGDWRFPIEQLSARGAIEGDVVQIESMTTSAFGGTGALSGRFQLNERRPARAEVTIDGMRLERLLAAQSDGVSKYAGAIVLDGTFEGDLAHLDERMNGGGELTLTEGRLEMVPVISNLVGHLRGIWGGAPDDRAEATLVLSPNTIAFNKAKLISDGIAARGEGTINLDGVIDFLVNAGPLESVQERLGGLGAVFGAVTDALVKYHLYGEFGDVTVTVRPFGL